MKNRSKEMELNLQYGESDDSVVIKQNKVEIRGRWFIIDELRYILEEAESFSEYVEIRSKIENKRISEIIEA